MYFSILRQAGGVAAVFILVSLIAPHFFSKQVPCANSISCKTSPKFEVEKNAIGIFNNKPVKAIDYITSDEEFNEIVYDFRGNPQFSTMITKLCSYNHRSEFILKVLQDMLKENDKQQVMILAHNKNLLKYLYDAIECRKIATVGYYVGGMKEKALKLSEEKQVIIATYSMAAEALDIKTLTTLIMATPKTDIEQAVGRILRVKHGSPVVVDIIDKHKIFQNQWSKRRIFYKKQNYKIIHTTNLDYNTSTDCWSTVYDPNNVSSCKKEKEKDDVPSGFKDPILQGKCLIKVRLP